jgi:hypothetical protein
MGSKTLTMERRKMLIVGRKTLTMGRRKLGMIE